MRTYSFRHNSPLRPRIIPAISRLALESQRRKAKEMTMGVDVVRATDGASLSWREARDVSQRVARMECGAALEVVRTRALEAIECARLEAIENVGTVALGEATSLHQHASLHASRNPKLASRLTYIADEAALLIGVRMSRFGRTLG